jgi:hypothetical protein
VYTYETEKVNIFTESGQRKFLAIRDNVQKLLRQSGAVRMQEALTGATGDSWESMACVDRLVELGEIRELKYGDCAGQHRVFVSAREP